MFKRIALVPIIALALCMVWAQGFEDFENSNATSGYTDNSFVGNGGIIWHYYHSRNQDVYPINGNGLMLRRASDSYLEASIPGGIGSFSFDYRKAFTGASARQLEFYVNNNLMGTTDVFGGSSGEDDTVYNFLLDDVNIPGTVTIKIKNVGTTSTNRQTTIDNISWTAFADAEPIINVLSHMDSFSVQVGSASSAQSFKVSGVNLEDDISILAPSNYELSFSEVGEYQEELHLEAEGGIVYETSIWVRLKAGLPVGSYAELITISSLNADEISINLNGEVLAPPPPLPPWATAAIDVLPDAFTATWDASVGSLGYKLDVYTKHATFFATELFISEYVEGTGYHKAIEIYNGTDADVDLSEYSLKKQLNGAGEFQNELALSGTLLSGKTYVVASNIGTPNLAGYDFVDLITNSQAINFNGNDAVALFKNDDMIDVVGMVDQDVMWGENVTFVRKPDVSDPNPDYDSDEWITFATDTFYNLGNHEFEGGWEKDYLIGHQDQDLGYVFMQQITDLEPDTNYFYVVRAYHEYSSSLDSNEISVITAKVPIYDFNEGEENEIDGSFITITGGNANYSTGEHSVLPNSSFVPIFQEHLTLIGAGPWDFTIQTTEEWVAYRQGSAWFSYEVTGGEVSFQVLASKDSEIELIIGSGGEPTLPVELSHFAAIITAQNFVQITWVSQSESNLLGYNIYRNQKQELSSAIKICELIEGTNSSEAHTYKYIDSELEQSGSYYYWLQNVDMDGNSSYHGPVSVIFGGYEEEGSPSLPFITKLENAYPNPFNPNTNIRYQIKAPGKVKIDIYNIKGQKVRSFKQSHDAAGFYQINWDGRDEAGRSVSSGVYQYKMSSDGYSAVKRMVLKK